MKFRLGVVGAALVACCLIAAQPAFAGTRVLDAVVAGQRLNVASDKSVEYIIKGAGNTDTALEVGDSLRGILDIDKLGLSGSPTELGSNGYNELTGIFQTKVVAKSGSASTGYTYFFGPDSAFSEAQNVNNVDLRGKAMVLFFEDPQQNYESDDAWGSTGPFADDIGKATDGAFWMALGFNGTVSTSTGKTNLGEGWIASVSYDDPSGLPEGTTLGTALFGLNRILAGTGDGELIEMAPRTIDGFTNVETNGFTNFYIGEINTTTGLPVSWPITDKADFYFTPTSIAPLPGAAWMGFALLGALGLGRRLRRRR